MMDQSLWGYCLSSWAKILLIYSVPFQCHLSCCRKRIYWKWYMKNALRVRPVSNILNYTKLSVKQSGVSRLWCASCHSNWLLWKQEFPIWELWLLLSSASFIFLVCGARTTGGDEHWNAATVFSMLFATSDATCCCPLKMCREQP